KRLELIVEQKSELEQKQKKSEEKLASQQGDGGARTRSEYDLDKDDWVDLAKKGSVKFRTPCFEATSWTFSPDRLTKLGLAPSDAGTIREAYERSYKRIWAQVRPLCAQALGIGDVVDKIGPDACQHLIYDVALATDKDATTEAHTQAAEIRAGL